jgi:hypothetical protein
MVTVKPRGRTNKGEFLKTCEWKGTNTQQILRRSNIADIDFPV